MTTSDALVSLHLRFLPESSSTDLSLSLTSTFREDHPFILLKTLVADPQTSCFLSSVILIMTQDSLYPKVQSALQQVKARKGQPSASLFPFSVASSFLD